MAASMVARSTSECSEGSGANDCELQQELGLLEAIYVNELNVDYSDSGVPDELSIVLHPATAGNVDQQYVCLTLNLQLPEQYPQRLPEITVRNPRGVSDEHIASLGAKLNQIAAERQGGAMLYELIEVAKESLTSNNTPSCQCVICLHGFTETDVFTRTPCYHYFHSQCLARYLKHAQENEEECVCAVCREPVSCDLAQLEGAPPPSSLQEVYTPNKAIHDMQRKMAALYKRQKEKGGIIDVEAENKKFLIHISQSPTLPANVGITPVAALPQNQARRSPVSLSDMRRAPPTEEGMKELPNESARSAVQVDKKDASDAKGSRPRSAHRNDFKQGGRGGGWGQGSRGRGQRRPGARDHHSTNPGSGRRSEFKGQRVNNEASAKYTGSENTPDRSNCKTENADVIDQSKEFSKKAPMHALGTRSKDQHHWSGRQKNKFSEGENRHSKEEINGGLNETLPKPNEEVAKDEKRHKNKKKSGKLEQERAENTPLKSSSGMQQEGRTASSKHEVDENKSSLDRDSRSKVSGTNSNQESPSRKDGENRQKRRHGGRNGAPKVETGSSQKANRSSNKGPRKLDENSRQDCGSHDDKQHTDSANSDITGADHEIGSGRTRRRNRNRRGETSQSKNSPQSDVQGKGQDDTCERSKGKADIEEKSEKKGSANVKIAVAEVTSQEGGSKSEKWKPDRGPPPGFSKRTISHQPGWKPTSVKPPPGFENVKL
ncbi:protein SPT2 homolog [Acanthaster planci]|uniref:Protein SPT2 homolog n=1 Tax=Acanthaster planci TaxID=133434 RepID=A0A8B7XY79_ACAPL|nr:protein SPT2 homolog [Acanthaster planci]